MNVLFLILLCVVLFVFYVNNRDVNNRDVNNRDVLNRCVHNRDVKQFIEEFDELVSFERQQRAGPMTVYDIQRKQLLQAEFPTIPTYFVPFERFYIELFSENNFKHKIAELKDATGQLLAITTRKPIKSFRIRSVPNDNWRFLQFFSVGIHTNVRNSTDGKENGIIFHVPHVNGKSVDYKVPDTSEEFPWMKTTDRKTVYFITNIYDPLQDLQ